ncbi:CGG triplet repeat-binding protein 1-like [Anoplophora glabripennis]|uniref:CGG triplet repeat-binding protein 1-like n=1 Tax=Anoplophora glabripennis TaxID=217634 RepID=UPI000C78C0D3|nr:CGG triplet repeat-binding protein 1-like [Anoplophora glabripennis]
MPKIQSASWIKPYPELILDGDRIFCKACSKIVSCSKKFQVDQHAKTPSHISKANRIKSGPVQSTLKQAVEVSSNQHHGQTKFNEDLCRMFLATNIPLHKMTNPQVKAFLQKYCKFNTPDESTLRKNVVGKVYASVIEEI